jgi:5'-3' exonuclease
MKIHLVDGTYELFRAYYGAPSTLDPKGREVGATRGLLRSFLSLLRQDDVTHVACAFDHVIESFRNDLFSGYKTGEGIEPELWAQFELAERAADALGMVVWPMVKFEADDALAAGAARWRDAPGVEQIVICSPDKDLTQCVVGKRVRSPTGWDWSVTPRTVFQGFLVGAPNRRLVCWPVIGTSRRFRKRRFSGM